MSSAIFPVAALAIIATIIAIPAFTRWLSKDLSQEIVSDLDVAQQMARASLVSALHYWAIDNGDKQREEILLEWAGATATVARMDSLAIFLACAYGHIRTLRKIRRWRPLVAAVHGIASVVLIVVLAALAIVSLAINLSGASLDIAYVIGAFAALCFTAWLCHEVMARRTRMIRQYSEVNNGSFLP